MNYKVCEGCGAHLDPGEICEDCLGFNSFKELYSAIDDLKRGSDFSSEAEVDALIKDVYSQKEHGV